MVRIQLGEPGKVDRDVDKRDERSAMMDEDLRGAVGEWDIHRKPRIIVIRHGFVQND